MSNKKYPYTLRRVGATIIDYSIVIGISVFYIVQKGLPKKFAKCEARRNALANSPVSIAINHRL
jgi:hypothetical protein